MSYATRQEKPGFPVLPKAGLLAETQHGSVKRAPALESVRVGRITAVHSVAVTWGLTLDLCSSVSSSVTGITLPPPPSPVFLWTG